MDIKINCAEDVGELPHFWHSTGFSPARLLLDADMRQQMIYAGSMPHGGITHVRIHYLLELVRAEGLGSEQPTYDWSALDKALDVLIENRLKPFFELMGNPEGYFDNFADDTQVQAWRRLVRDLALHYIERYGRDEVLSWYFETWNEPDAGWWQQTEKAFCNYYDACSEGLKDADPAITFGGPGSCRGLSHLLQTFLAHCDSGTNYFTGETGVRLDFISVHEKGVRSAKEDLTPDSMGISQRELAIIHYIREHHPRLTDVPFMNNECDPQVGWMDSHTWRATPYHAALAAKIINQHLLMIRDEAGCNYTILSNDNGFVGEWGKRTLCARFGDIVDVRAQSEYRSPEANYTEDETRRAFAMLKKPVLNVMALMALLGDRRCAISDLDDPAADIGMIATRRGADQVAILIYNSSDRITVEDEQQITLQLTGLPFERAALAHYRLDQGYGNPYRIWEELGAPRYPSADDYASMRRHQEPALSEAPREVIARSGRLTYTFTQPMPGVSLLLLHTKPADAPGPVSEVRTETFQGMTGQRETMVMWDGLESRAIRTYEVLYAVTPDGPYERVNDVDLICTAYLHAHDGDAGHYKVRAVDYWGRRGPLSS